MKVSQRVLNEVADFIQFGVFLDKPSRKFLVSLIYQHLFEKNFDTIAELTQSEFHKLYPNWSNILIRLFQDPQLRNLTLQNADFSLGVLQASLTWFQRQYQLLSSEKPKNKETSEINSFRENRRSFPVETWKSQLIYLMEQYPGRKRDWLFFEEQLNKAGETSWEELATLPSYDSLPLLLENILQSWEEEFQKKYQMSEKQLLEKIFQDYYSDLQGKITSMSDLGDLLSPFYGFLGLSWTATIGNWNHINWDKLEEVAKKLQDDPSLKDLAEQLGRWQLEKQIEEEMSLYAPEMSLSWKPNPIGKSEIVGVHHSNDLSALLPSEIALLSSPDTEIVFSKRFVEKKLLTFQYQSLDADIHKQQKEKPILQAPDQKRGPIILVIDTSGSMFGDPEKIAKALSFAILEIALKQKRRAFAISFSTQIRTLELSSFQHDVEPLIDFLQLSFHGGTDIQPALKKAIDMVGEEAFRYADILVISDFIIPKVETQLMSRIIQVRKEQGVRFHSLYISRRKDNRSIPITLFDHHWTYNLEQPGVVRQNISELEKMWQKKSPTD
ncbi:MAG: VWA domain-containing protein [Bacteroidota bacterium]